METRSGDTKRNEPTVADNVVGGLLCWIFVVVGVSGIAAGTLIPAYYETLETREQRKVMEHKAELLRAERDRYVDFHEALIEDDPILLERLAFTQLRLKPVGTETTEFGAIDPAAVIDSPDPDTIQQVAMQWQSRQSVEFWLSRPDLKEQAEPPPHVERPRETRLTRVATGEYRPLVAGVGALILLAGVWPRRTTASSSLD